MRIKENLWVSDTSTQNLNMRTKNCFACARANFTRNSRFSSCVFCFFLSSLAESVYIIVWLLVLWDSSIPFSSCKCIISNKTARFGCQEVNNVIEANLSGDIMYLYFTLFLSFFFVSIPNHTFGLTDLTEYIQTEVLILFEWVLSVHSIISI